MLLEATKMDPLDFHWTPLLKLVAYSQLSLEAEAEEHFNILCGINPDFENRPLAYIECLVKTRALSDQMYHSYSSVSEAANQLPISRH